MEIPKETIEKLMKQATAIQETFRILKIQITKDNAELIKSIRLVTDNEKFKEDGDINDLCDNAFERILINEQDRFEKELGEIYDSINELWINLK